MRPDGTFALANVPPGTRKLVLWGPRLKPTTQLVEIRPNLTITFTATPLPPRIHLNKHGRAYGSYDD